MKAIWTTVLCFLGIALLPSAISRQTWDGSHLSGSRGIVLFPERGLELHIAFKEDLDHRGLRERSAESFDVRVVCTWTNVSKRKVTFLLKDHDAYRGTMAFPWGLSCGLDAEPKTPASKAIDDYYQLPMTAPVSSGSAQVEPGDLVELRPRESVVRIVSLEDLLVSERFVPDVKKFFPIGTYRIKVSMELPIESVETLTLHIQPKSEKAQSLSKEATPRGQTME